MKTIKIYDRYYVVGKSKTTTDFVIFEYKNGAWKNIFEGTKEDVKEELKHIRKMADKREARHLIAEMNGTSYRAAKEDMGL
jgi:hypothetical protein